MRGRAQGYHKLPIKPLCTLRKNSKTHSRCVLVGLSVYECTVHDIPSGYVLT